MTHAYAEARFLSNRKRRREAVLRTWNLYCLFAVGRIKYIGITSGPVLRRLWNHLTDARSFKSKHTTSEWIRGVEASGKSIRIRLLKSGLTSDRAKALEKHLVTIYKNRLTNTSNGGNCGPISEMDIIRKKQSRWPNKQLTRRERMLLRMANMRAAKERKRLSNPLSEPDPKFTPWHPLELGLRDKITGETAWVDFVSLRDAMRRLAVVRRFYL